MTIQLHGKEYVEVKDRVAAAHLEDSYSMLKEETFAMGGREYVRVYIDVKGKQYIGTAECKFNAAPKSPDGMSPFECGETSALGRALGFAGYGVVDSIASADEVVSNQQNGNRQEKHTLRSLYDLGKKQGLWSDTSTSKFYAKASEVAGRVQSKTAWDMTLDEMGEMAKQLYEQIPAGVTGAN